MFELLMQRVCSLNNNGIRLFEAGRSNEGIEQFKMCIDQISEIELLIDNVLGNEDCCSSNSNTTPAIIPESSLSSDTRPIYHLDGWSKAAIQFGESSARTTCHDDLAEDRNLESNHATGGNNIGNIFLYSRALRIREREGGWETPTEACSSLNHYYAAAQYNLALSHHIFSLQPDIIADDADERKTILRRVYRLYENALIRCMGMSVNDQDGDYLHFTLLVVVLFNNTGVIYAEEEARFQAAYECFKAACDLLRQMDPERAHQAFDEGDDMHLLMMNAFTVPTKTSPAA